MEGLFGLYREIFFIWHNVIRRWHYWIIIIIIIFFFITKKSGFLQSVNTVSPIWPCFPSCPGTPCSPFGPWIIFGIVKDAIRAVALQVHVPGSPFFPGGPCSILISLSLQIYTLSTKGKLCYVRWWVTNG